MTDPNYLAPSREEVRANLAKLRDQIPAASDEQGWEKLIASYGFSQREMEANVRREMQMMNFIEVRLRPNVHVQPEEVEAYYRTQVLPDMEKAGVKVVTLQEVEPKNPRTAGAAAHGRIAGCVAAQSAAADADSEYGADTGAGAIHTTRWPAESSMTENAPVRRSRTRCGSGRDGGAVCCGGRWHCVCFCKRDASRTWCGTAWWRTRESDRRQGGVGVAALELSPLEIEANDLTIHGLESAGRCPAGARGPSAVFGCASSRSSIPRVNLRPLTARSAGGPPHREPDGVDQRSRAEGEAGRRSQRCSNCSTSPSGGSKCVTAYCY